MSFILSKKHQVSIFKLFLLLIFSIFSQSVFADESTQPTQEVTDNYKEFVFSKKNYDEAPTLGKMAMNVTDSVTFSTKKAMTVVAILGVLACFGSFRLYRRASMEDNDVEKTKYSTAGLVLLIVGALMLSFSLYFLALNDTFGIGQHLGFGQVDITDSEYSTGYEIGSSETY